MGSAATFRLIFLISALSFAPPPAAGQEEDGGDDGSSRLTAKEVAGEACLAADRFAGAIDKFVDKMEEVKRGI